MTTKPIVLPPSVDEHAEQYKFLEAQVLSAKKALDEKKEELVKLVQKTGSMPAGASKSFRIEGDAWRITASFGTSSSIDKLAVDRVREQLVIDGKPGLFKRLFEAETAFVVSPTSHSFLENCSDKVRKLFALCTVTKPKDPSLKVEKKNGSKKGGRR